jgi:hypothetical protein
MKFIVELFLTCCVTVPLMIAGVIDSALVSFSAGTLVYMVVSNHVDTWWPKE